jgi:hypothetical protein
VQDVAFGEIGLDAELGGQNRSQSRPCPSFSLLHELSVKATVPNGLVEIASGLAVQCGQPTVCRNQPREHAQGSLEREHRALTMAQAREGNSQVKMSERQEMLQTDGQ